MTRIHFYVHGRGRGHATRSLPIVEALRERGQEVTVFVGEGAQPLFAGDCEPVVSLPLGLPRGLAALMSERISSARARMRQEGVAVVVSDGDLPAVLAAKQQRVASIAVGHGLVFACCRRPKGAPALAWAREAQKARLASLGATHRVAVNFLRLPLRDPARTSLVRPLLPPAARARGSEALTSSAPTSQAAPVVCYFRDADGDDIAVAAARAGRPVLLFGAEHGPALPGVTRAPFDAGAFGAALDGAAAVISSAGSQLMSECLMRRIPQLARYADADDEQRLNGHMLGQLGGPSRSLPASRCDSAAIAAFVAGLGDRSGTQDWPPALSFPEQDVVTAVVGQVQRLASTGSRSRGP